MIRVVVAGDDETANPAARAMRDAGMEVIYAGPHREPERIVHTALQEDADAIALTGMTALEQIRDLLTAQRADDVVVIAFPSDMPPSEIVDQLHRSIAP